MLPKIPKLGNERAAFPDQPRFPGSGRTVGALLATKTLFALARSSFHNRLSRTKQLSNPSSELLTLHYFIARQRGVLSTSSAQFIESQLVRQPIHGDRSSLSHGKKARPA